MKNQIVKYPTHLHWAPNSWHAAINVKLFYDLVTHFMIHGSLTCCNRINNISQKSQSPREMLNLSFNN